ncbi:(Fe-S)-binding protein [Desulfopila inferna]|uniref:(Fe-S)-binding protein n=1 Tax=Desulfopila inferna TaxID=468528 RepID=UPI001964DB28|nr:(Fe-S)-binding protein [Desulfopila inferna]MBM9606541.1 (Fe-S)-binding protein [Desulfopila inferna]
MNVKSSVGREAEAHLLEAAKEFQKCMQCGKCRSVCPVFKEMGNELYVARGKNKLAEKIVSGDLEITDRVEDAINQCLNCKTCSANCPAGVSPEHVVLRLRWYITTQKGLHFFKALIFRQLLWRKWPITLGCAIVGITQKMLFGIGPKNPVRHLFPLFGFSKRRNFPQLAIRSAQSQLAEINPPKSGTAKMRVGYFTGCAGNLIYTNVARSVVDILTDYGYEVVIPKKQKCNGTPVLANGDYEGAKRLMEHNFALFRKYELDAIVVSCSSCGMALKKEIKVFLDDSPELSEFTGKVYDINEFIVKNVEIRPEHLGRIPYKVTYHDPCHMARGQGIRDQPRDILKMIPGVEFTEMKNADTCCGSAGSYCITHYDTAIKINNHKIKDIGDAGVDMVATACPTCVMHIADNLKQHDREENVRFVVEILADSLRAAKTI